MISNLSTSKLDVAFLGNTFGHCTDGKATGLSA